jgi:hypothetical protein
MRLAERFGQFNADVAAENAARSHRKPELRNASEWDVEQENYC